MAKRIDIKKLRESDLQPFRLLLGEHNGPDYRSEPERVTVGDVTYLIFPTKKYQAKDGKFPVVEDIVDLVEKLGNEKFAYLTKAQSDAAKAKREGGMRARQPAHRRGKPLVVGDPDTDPDFAEGTPKVHSSAVPDNIEERNEQKEAAIKAEHKPLPESVEESEGEGEAKVSETERHTPTTHSSTSGHTGPKPGTKRTR